VKIRQIGLDLLVVFAVIIIQMFAANGSGGGSAPKDSQHVFYRTVEVDGLSIFYREAGPKEAPTILLFHGLPSSSRMFEPLFARLSDRFHLVAPDYPGFGHSDWPDPKKFAYTFDHLAESMNHFTEALGLSRYTLYMQDYGGPVGFRCALAHPERVEALIVQDAVAHNEGLGANWKTRRFGKIAQPMKMRFAQIFSHCRRRGRVMSGPIQTSIATILICGRTSSRF
jgi:pimeloyl-ACP methyl ester carboxylesterase